MRIITAVAAAMLAGGLAFVIWFVYDAIQETGSSGVPPAAASRGVNTDILEKIETQEAERREARPPRDDIRNPFQKTPEVPNPPAPANPAPSTPTGGNEPPAVSQ